jgi:ABC-type lipoprotein export system ATPase subunit
MVTHDPTAAAAGDRLVRLRDGQIEAILAADERG